MAWSKVLFTGIKRSAWYHLASSDLLISDRALRADGCCWIGGIVGLLLRLTCHIPDVDDLLPSITVSPSLTTLRQVSEKVAMHPSSHSFPIDMRDPGCMWGRKWDVQVDWAKREFRLSSALWVACTILP